MVDKQLDKIEVMLLKLSNDDIYKEALESEYTLYRSVLEALPRNVNIPDKLYSSVLSLEQRLNYYVVMGKSSNPLIELAPTITLKVTDENDKAELLEFVKSNPSYIASRKSKLDVLKGYLDKIDFSGSIEDIASMIKIVKQKYDDSNVRSHLFEQEIAKANYYYVIRLLCDGKDEAASIVAQDFDYDMVLFIYNHHKDNVHKLLEKGKPSLADKLNDFLMELPKDREKELDFWKVLTQIENPEYDPQKADIIVNEENSIVVDDAENYKLVAKGKGRVSLLFKNLSRKLSNNSPRLISKKNYKVFITDEKVTINLDLYRDFRMETAESNELRDFLGFHFKKNSNPFTNGEVYIKECNNDSDYKNAVGFRSIINKICEYLHIKKLEIQSLNTDHGKDDGMFQGFFFEEVIISGGTWTIGKYYFSKCTSLKIVDFSNTTIRKIDDGAFYDCLELEKVVFPYGMRDYSFGVSVFHGCRSLKEMKLPLDVTQITFEMFKDCKNLEVVELLSIKEIGYAAFEGCEKLKDVGRNGSVKKIGKRAFYGCKSLKFFSFLNQLSVDDYAFAYTGLEDASLKTGFKTTGKGIFMGSMIKTASFTGELHLPSEMYKDCANLHSVYLADDISVFGDECFSGCKNLTSISLPKINSIGVACFKECTALRSIYFGSSISCISKQLFKNCTSLVSFKVPKTEAIDDEAFCGCRRLEELEFVDSGRIIKLGEKAFKDCERLKELPQFNSLKFIGKYCFSKCDLKQFYLPDSIIELGEGAFNECKYLTSINIPKSIREIAKCMFKGCYSLTELDLSDCFIEFIDDEALYGCEALKVIKLGKGLRKVGKNVFKCSDAIEAMFLSASLFDIPENEYKNAIKDWDCLNDLLKKLGIYNLYSVLDAKLLGDNIVELRMMSFARQSNLPSRKAPLTKDGSLDLRARANIKIEKPE